MEQKNCEICNAETCSAKQPKPNETQEEFIDRQKLEGRLCRIKHKIVVLSGKGGVGKSTIAVNLAFSLALAGKQVGLLDVDIHGPSVPQMLNLKNISMQAEGSLILPIEIGAIKVMSIAFFLPRADDPVIWRGPMKMSMIRQFLRDVAWGELDYLIIDAPPGTGDEPLSVCQLIEKMDGALIVTTPQEVALNAVRKSVNFCRQIKLPVLGVVENMSGFVCPKCGEVSEIFKTGGGEKMATDMQVPFLGRIPLDPEIGQACDEGAVFIKKFEKTHTADIFAKVIKPIVELESITKE
ncbi:Mrp/NBP35 family ATP-binding protein [bacterium]|nr:Mrp/NBP35 family ATP-binding protein [bacterium]